MTTGTCTLTGLSGQSYPFRLYTRSAGWKSRAGLYAFATHSPEGLEILYIGESENLATRISGHEKRGWAERYGAQFVMALPFEGEASSRKSAEADLIRAYQPALNVKLRS
ncbi:MAG TPA: GIY-YIG nuclease family protein [bacterium]